MERIHSFPPIIADGARILILGTMPSAESLRQGFYYSHPRNAFWSMLASVFGAATPESADEKRDLILQNRLALWDVAQSCERVGSLDSAIREPVANDVRGLILENPSVRKVLLNGGTAARLYRTLIGDVEGTVSFVMPSTSPAYTIPFQKKRDAWAEKLLGEDD